MGQHARTDQGQGAQHMRAEQTTARRGDPVAEITRHLNDVRAIASHAVQERLDDFRENADAYYHRGLNQAQMIEKSAERSIQRHPLISIAIAGFVGLLFGALWARK